MVGRIVFILVEPTGHDATAGSRAARKGGNNCCARTGEPFRRRFSRTVHRLQAWHPMRKIHAASKTVSRSALHFMGFSTRRQTTAHDAQANNTKEKSCWLYRGQWTKRGAGQPCLDTR